MKEGLIDRLFRVFGIKKQTPTQEPPLDISSVQAQRLKELLEDRWHNTGGRYSAGKTDPDAPYKEGGGSNPYCDSKSNITSPKPLGSRGSTG